MDKCYKCSDMLNTDNNWLKSNAKTSKYICTPCHHKYKNEQNNYRAAFILASGLLTSVRRQSKNTVFDKHSDAKYLGIFDKRSISLEDYVKSLNVNYTILTSIIPIKAKHIRKKKFKTAEQAAKEIESRVETVNKERLIQRKARKKPLIACLRDHNGVIFGWFEDMWDKTTHCPATGIEFEPDGPFQKSPDQILPGGNYTEENIRVVCLIYNLGKNVFTDEDVIKMCEGVLKVIELGRNYDRS